MRNGDYLAAFQHVILPIAYGGWRSLVLLFRAGCAVGLELDLSGSLLRMVEGWSRSCPAVLLLPLVLQPASGPVAAHRTPSSILQSSIPTWS